MYNAAIELVTMNTPSAKAVIFGFSIQGHSLMEVFLGVIIVILFFKKSFRHPTKPLTEQEIDELCYEWVPEPLIPPITQQVNHEPLVLESAAGPHTIVNGRDVVNFASANYLGLIGHDKLLESCTSALEKYGVGSCGPRGFYGTIDVHLDCETRISKFLGTPGSILYSYGLSTMFSIIPCFCKKGDIIVADEGVHWGIQNGLQLSRSTIVYFKHNDMDSLRNTLESIMKKHKRTKNLRRYIVAEAIYQVTCNTHISRFLMLVKLKQNIALLWKGLLGIKGMILSSNNVSPIVFLKLEKSRGSAKEDLILLLEEIADRALKEDSLLVVRSKRSVIDKCVLPLGIKLYVSAAHSESDNVKASESMKRLASEILL